jgi:hypothetical protein
VEAEGIRQPLQQPEEIKPRNFFSRLGGVYFSPGETFREIGRSPGVWAPIIALILISALAGYLLSQKVDMSSLLSGAMEKAVADGSMTQQQADQQMAAMSKLGGVQLIAGSAVSNVIIALIIAAIFKLFAVIAGVENRFKALFTVTVYTLIATSIVQSILLFAVLSFRAPAEMSITNMGSVLASNLGALISGVLGDDALPKFLMKLFGWIDVFAIWDIALLSIGYAAVSGKLKTSRVAVWLGSFYGIIAIIGAAISSFMS